MHDAPESGMVSNEERGEVGRESAANVASGLGCMGGDNVVVVLDLALADSRFEPVEAGARAGKYFKEG